MASTSQNAFARAQKPARHMPRFSSFRTIGALILREMNTSYGRSPGGYIWAVLQPAAGIAVMVAIFSAGFRSPPLGSNFAIFYATGFMPFMMFMDIAGKLGQALNYSRPFLGYPRITFMDAILARFVLNFLTQLLVSYLLIAGILYLFDTRTTLEMDRIFLAYTMAASFGFGIGVMNCFLMSLTPLWQQIWSVVTRPLIFISGILFMYDSTPDPYRSYLWYNPLIHIVGEMRAAFYFNYGAEYVDPIYVYTISLILSLFGLLFLRRYHLHIINT